MSPDRNACRILTLGPGTSGILAQWRSSSVLARERFQPRKNGSYTKSTQILIDCCTPVQLLHARGGVCAVQALPRVPACSLELFRDFGQTECSSPSPYQLLGQVAYWELFNATPWITAKTRFILSRRHSQKTTREETKPTTS